MMLRSKDWKYRNALADRAKMLASISAVVSLFMGKTENSFLLV